MIGNKKVFRKLIIPVIILALLILSGLGVYKIYAKISSEKITEKAKGVERRYSILITGFFDNSDFLKQINDGVASVSNFYDSVAHCFFPESQNKSRSLQYLFDYAGYINADCVICYFDSIYDSIRQPVNIDGKVIPMISVGVYSPGISKISHIGIDYEKLKQKMVEEVNLYFGKNEGCLYILDVTETGKKSEGNFSEELYSELKKNKDISIYQFSKMGKTGLPIEDEVRQQIASLGEVDLILSVSETATLIAAQSVLDLNIASKTKIIGFGESHESLTYLKKGFVLELFCSDAVDIGKKAVQQFFEYKETGSTSNYVTSDIKIIKAQ